MSFDAQNLTDPQRKALNDEMNARGVKFLPGQVVRRLVDSEAKGLGTLGASRRAKTARVAKREAAAKLAAAPKTEAVKAPAAPKKEKAAK